MRIQLLAATAVLALMAAPAFAQTSTSTTPTTTAPAMTHQAAPATTPAASTPSTTPSTAAAPAAASTAAKAAPTTTKKMATKTAAKATHHAKRHITLAQRRRNECGALTTQFTTAASTHATAKGIVKAKALAQTGENQCHAGHTIVGIRHLRQALRNLGEKPRA